MSSSRTISLTLVSLVTVVSCVIAEDSFSFKGLFDVVKDKFQNVTSDVETMLKNDVPAVEKKVEAALVDHAKDLQQSAQSIQKKLEDYNVTGSTLGELWGKIKGQVNSTVVDLTKPHPNVDQLLGQVKTGFSSIVDVGVQVANEVGKQAGTVSEDLKTIAQHAHTELSKAVTQLEVNISGNGKKATAGK